MRALSSFLLFIARLCLAAIFIFAASSKIIFFDDTAQYMASKGFTMIPLFLFGAAIVEFIGGLSLVFGLKTRFGALILLLFLVPTTLIFHDFWNASGLDKQIQQLMFLKNVAIFGGLLYVLCIGAGWFSLDSWFHKKQPEDKS